MKVKNVSDFKRLMEVLCNCKGKVELVTSEGDRLNLQSTLCQYIAFTEMFSEAKISEIEIIASDPEDKHRILEYMISG